MKLIINVKDIPQILASLNKIMENDSCAINTMGMYTSADCAEVIRHLRFVEENNTNLHGTNGPDTYYSPIAKEIELTYDEYSVVVIILRMARNLRENKHAWCLA